MARDVGVPPAEPQTKRIHPWNTQLERATPLGTDLQMRSAGRAAPRPATPTSDTPRSTGLVGVLRPAGAPNSTIDRPTAAAGRPKNDGIEGCRTFFKALPWNRAVRVDSRQARGHKAVHHRSTHNISCTFKAGSKAGLGEAHQPWVQGAAGAIIIEKERKAVVHWASPKRILRGTNNCQM